MAEPVVWSLLLVLYFVSIDSLPKPGGRNCSLFSSPVILTIRILFIDRVNLRDVKREAPRKATADVEKRLSAILLLHRGGLSGVDRRYDEPIRTNKRLVKTKCGLGARLFRLTKRAVDCDQK